MDWDKYNQRIKWFQHDRFGMFIHFGIYAIPARGEFVKSNERISDEDYDKYFKAFNPSKLDAKAWAKCAKEAGMKYAVLTAKHHDGFCLFDSALTDYKSTNTPYGKDIIREYVDAFRAEGLKVGLYYSLIDWHHPDYPHYGDPMHPMRENPEFKGVKHNFDNYLNYMHGQIKELCTNYGKIDILWFDFSYDEMRGEKWRATDLINMVRSYQPDVIIDNRLEVSGEGFGSIATDNPSVYSGDFVSPEQTLPPKCMYSESGRPLVWEACITMNNSWGYNRGDKDFKSADGIIKKLVECVSKGGNMLLNVGPDATGSFPDESIKILREIGCWMNKNSDSIYGCGYADIEKPEYGRYTRRNKEIFYHLTENTIGPVPISGIKESEIEKISLLSDKSELPLVKGWILSNYPEYVFTNYGAMPFNTYALPDKTDTVIKIKLK